MYFEVGIEVDEALIVHVDLVEPTHANQYYNQSLAFEMHPASSPSLRHSLTASQLPTQQRSPSQPLLQLQIELQNGSKVYISPQPCDEPVRLATEFCEQHNLDTDMIDILAESIKKSLHRSRYQQSSNDCKQNGLRSPQYFSKKGSVNSALSLYEKGVMLEEARKHWIARQNQRKIMEEMRECTHQPKINQLSRSLITHAQTHSKEKAERQCSQLASLRTSIMLECPSAQHLRTQPSTSTHQSCSVFNKLYDARKPDEVVRSKILQEMMRQETYHPAINDVSKEIVGNATFAQRLLKYQKQKQQKTNQRKRVQQAQKENMHRPKTGAPPQNRNLQKMPIGDFLYAKRKKAISIKTEVQQPIINPTSKHIYHKRKSAAFERIFFHLCGKKDRIQWQTLNNGSFDPSLRAILHPLLEQIEIMQIQLNMDDFKAAIEFLFGSLSPTDKGILLNFGLQKQAEMSQKAKPLVNKNSEVIARNMGRCQFSIYDYCNIKQGMKQQRMQQERLDQERKEMSQCTFEPIIHRTPLYY